MAGATLTTADAALKEWYLPGAREQLNNEIPFLAQVEKNYEMIEGRRAVLSLHMSRNSGVGARPELGTLPTAGSQGYAEERVPVYRQYGSIQLSGPSIRAMKSNSGSFVRQTESEMTGVTNDLKRDVSRQAWGDQSGKIVTLGTTSNTVKVTVATTATAVQMRGLSVGMVIDIGTVASPTTVVSAATIVSIDDTVGASYVTIDSAVTTSSSHFIFRSGSVGVNTSYEINGAQSIVSSAGTLFNVNPSTYPKWKSYVNGNSGTNRALSENLMATVVQNVQIQSGDYPKAAICSDGVFRAYSSLLTSLKRSTNTTQLKGGYSALDFNAASGTIPVTWDRDCPSNKVFFFNWDNLLEVREADWEFMDEDGAVLSRVAGLDAYGATLFMYHELTTDQRNAHGLLFDVTEG